MTNPSIHHARILVVDDQPTNRELAMFFLKNAGFKVFAEASSGEETLAQVQTFKPDIILLDILMPEPNGFDVCKRLKENPATAHIPILFLSGLTDIKNRTLGYQLGAVDYVHKPIDRYEMCARVSVHLSNSLLQKNLQSYKDRVSVELAQARELQHSLLPQPQYIQNLTKKFPLVVKHHFTSSSELSGDYWGLFATPDRLAVMTLDFTGHGVAAALNSLRCHALLLELQPLLDKPLAFVHELNRRLYELLILGQFATCNLGLVNREGEAFILAAGTPPVGLYNSHDKNYTWLSGKGTPLGINPGPRFEVSTHEVQLNPGDSLLLYSDALIETSHTDESIWAIDGLQKTASKLGRKKDHQPLQDILSAFNATAQQPPRDDLTLVEIKYTGPR